MSDAYVETTVLTDALLKVGSKKQGRAQAALKRYNSTSLPVYSIKEWKAGPLETFAWVHDKLVLTKSIRATVSAIASITPYKPYKRSTSIEAWDAAAQLEARLPPGAMTTEHDKELANRYRLALESLILRSWQKRRSITSRTIQDLDCYTEAEPKLTPDGLFDLEPSRCETSPDCCLRQDLIAERDLLIKLRDAIPSTSSRKEDVERRQVLKQLINTPKLPLNRELCSRLGDAVFAFFCPQDAVVLTTNLKDHKPLAEAIGKKAEAP